MNQQTGNQPSIHGHEIIHLIHDAPTPFTPESLRAEVQRRFGDAARFHTCSAGGMTFDQLLGFLMSRGKVVERQGSLLVQMEEICEDGRR
jgi:probable metal-binding protein